MNATDMHFVNSSPDGVFGNSLCDIFVGPQTAYSEICKLLGEKIVEEPEELSDEDLRALRLVERHAIELIGVAAATFAGGVQHCHTIIWLDLIAVYLNRPSSVFLRSLCALGTVLEALASIVHYQRGWRHLGFTRSSDLVRSLVRVTNDFAVGRRGQCESFMGRCLVLHTALAFMCLARELMPSGSTTPWTPHWSTNGSFAYLANMLYYRDGEVRALGFALASMLARTTPGRDLLLRSFANPDRVLCSDGGIAQWAFATMGEPRESCSTRQYAALLLVSLTNRTSSTAELFGHVSGDGVVVQLQQGEGATHADATSAFDLSAPDALVAYLRRVGFAQSAHDVTSHFSGRVRVSNDARRNEAKAGCEAYEEQRGPFTPVFISRGLISAVARLLRNVIVDSPAAIDLLRCEGFWDTLSRCMQRFAVNLEGTWLEEGDVAVVEYLLAMSDAYELLSTTLFYNELLCAEVAASQCMLRAIVDGFTCQVDVLKRLLVKQHTAVHCSTIYPIYTLFLYSHRNCSYPCVDWSASWRFGAKRFSLAFCVACLARGVVLQRRYHSLWPTASRI